MGVSSGERGAHARFLTRQSFFHLCLGHRSLHLRAQHLTQPWTLREAAPGVHATDGDTYVIEAMIHKMGQRVVYPVQSEREERKGLKNDSACTCNIATVIIDGTSRRAFEDYFRHGVHILDIPATSFFFIMLDGPVHQIPQKSKYEHIGDASSLSTAFLMLAHHMVGQTAAAHRSLTVWALYIFAGSLIFLRTRNRIRVGFQFGGAVRGKRAVFFTTYTVTTI